MIFGRPPLRLLSYDKRATKLDVLDQALIDRDKMLAELRDHLTLAQ